MKISMRIFTILGGVLLLFSCENNSVSKKIASEQQRQDSLLLVSEKIIAEEKLKTTQANEEANKIKKEKADAEESDRIRIKKEHAEKIENEKKREQESKAYAEKAKGPQWIDGMWRYEGYVSTRMGSLYFNSALKIDRDSQTLVWVDGNQVIESGKYEVYNGSIHCNSTYWELDEVNHRISIGYGEYFFKN